jgi:hypothetical protein
MKAAKVQMVLSIAEATPKFTDLMTKTREVPQIKDSYHAVTA